MPHYDLLVVAEGPHRGQVCACQLAPAQWGRKEGPPQFAVVTADRGPRSGERWDLDAGTWSMECPVLSTENAPPRVFPGGRPAPGANSVSVIIAARNYRQYLGDAIHSAIHQSRPPLEVIYVDDGSDDGSLEYVRSKFGGRVAVIRQQHTGVCAARNLGLAAAGGEWVLHLDGDDVLPYGYLEQRLAAQKKSGADFVYGQAQAFGGPWNYTWDAPDWDPARLWVRNYVNTSTLFRRDQVLAVGGWREGVGTGWDWDLVMRLAQAGYRGHRDGEAVLLYRHHGQNASLASGEKQRGAESTQLLYLQRAAMARVTIGAVVSDRLPGLWPKWFGRLALCAGLWEAHLRSLVPAMPLARFELPALRLAIEYTGSADHVRDLHAELRWVTPVFDEIVVRQRQFINRYTSERERRHNVARFLAEAYNRLLDATDSELAWCVEDDVMPPPLALARLHEAVLSPATPLYAAGGWYRNRHRPEQWLSHQWQDGRAVPTTELPSEPTYYDLTGTGCLLMFRPLASHRFASHCTGIPAHDWAWSAGLKEQAAAWHPREKRVLLLPDVVCLHHRTLEEAV